MTTPLGTGSTGNPNDPTNPYGSYAVAVPAGESDAPRARQEREARQQIAQQQAQMKAEQQIQEYRTKIAAELQQWQGRLEASRTALTQQQQEFARLRARVQQPNLAPAMTPQTVPTPQDQYPYTGQYPLVSGYADGGVVIPAFEEGGQATWASIGFASHDPQRLQAARARMQALVAEAEEEIQQEEQLAMQQISQELNVATMNIQAAIQSDAQAFQAAVAQQQAPQARSAPQ